MSQINILPGRKDDNSKSPVWQGCFQYFPRALKRIADVSRYGLEKYDLKYSDVNWARVEGGINRYNDAEGRHILDEIIDGHVDRESSLEHAALRAWNAVAVLELMLREAEVNK